MLSSLRSILIATCPCALGLATPSALSCAVAHLNSHGILLKRADVLEQINKIDSVALDKTGTLTEGKFTLAECICLENQEKDHYLEIAASLEQFSSHPIADAFSEYPNNFSVTEFESFVAQGIAGFIEGEYFRLGSAKFIGLDIPTQLQTCHLFLATTKKIYSGFILKDKIRSSSFGLIKRFQSKHLTLLSGDGATVVQHVAETLHIPNWLAQQTPADKLSFIQTAQHQNHKVLMIGDGINDGPVLAQADVSITLGAGSDLAKSSADVILLDNSLDKVSTLLALAKRCKRKIIQNFAWALGYNLLILPLAVTGNLSPWIAVIGMSLSSLVVVLNSIRLLK